MRSKLGNITNPYLSGMAESEGKEGKYIRPQLTLLVFRTLLLLGIFSAITFLIFTLKAVLGKLGMTAALSFLSTEVATIVLFFVFLLATALSAVGAANEEQDKLIADKAGNLDGVKYVKKLTLSLIISAAAAVAVTVLVIVLDIVYAAYGSSEGVQDFLSMDIFGSTAAIIAPVFYPAVYFLCSRILVADCIKDVCPVCHRADYRVILARGESRPRVARTQFYLPERRHAPYGKFRLNKEGAPELEEGECVTFCKYCSLFVSGGADAIDAAPSGDSEKEVKENV